jgi:hypothetical protein
MVGHRVPARSHYSRASYLRCSEGIGIILGMLQLPTASAVQEYDFTSLPTCDGQATISFDLNRCNPDGVPHTLLIELVAVLGENQYAFKGRYGMRTNWKFTFPKQYTWGSRYTKAELTLTTPKTTRKYSRRSEWSQKANRLLDDNVRSLEVFFEDADYRDGLLRQLRGPWLQKQLQGQANKRVLIADEYDQAVAKAEQHFEWAMNAASRRRGERLQNLDRIRERYAAQLTALELPLDAPVEV